MYQEQFDNGEISEAQYKTLISTSARNQKLSEYVAPDPFLGSDNPYDET
jgi:hypothetical protein